ncbi:MAG: agmatinase [Bacteroidota bacterium]
MKTLGTNNNFLALEGEHSDFERSEIAVVSVPYEHTTSYGHGTSQGPESIIEASQQVEFYDEEFDRELCFDKGIATLEPLDLNLKYNSEALDEIRANIRRLLDMDKFVVTLGGEHTISQAVIQAHHEKFQDMCILHFDAHSDLRESYEGSEYSHACVMARVAEFFPTERITQVGIRAQCAEEAQFIRRKGITTFYASAIRRGLHGNNWQRKVAESLTDQVFITFDVDYFDPSIMPATGTPEPGGFLYSETLDIFRQMNELDKRIIGFDVVELAPIKGFHHADMTAARLAYKMLNFAFAGR